MGDATQVEADLDPCAAGQEEMALRGTKSGLKIG